MKEGLVLYKLWRKLFPIKEVEKYVVVEIEKPRQLPGEVPKESIETLQYHPGFQYLLQRFRLQSHALESRLKSNFHENLRIVDILQAGIFWCNWANNQLKEAVLKQKREAPQEALADETAAFEEIKNALDIIGA